MIIRLFPRVSPQEFKKFLIAAEAKKFKYRIQYNQKESVMKITLPDTLLHKRNKEIGDIFKEAKIIRHDESNSK